MNSETVLPGFVKSLLLLVHIALFSSWVDTGSLHAPLEPCVSTYILELSPLVPPSTTQILTASSSSTMAMVKVSL